MTNPRLRYSALSSLLLLIAGCSNQIGTSCASNVDCSPLGDRVCLTAQLDGYCTIEGCDVGTCPDEAVCIRTFPASYLSTICDPGTEDSLDPSVTPTNDCTRTEICLSSGLCAQRTAERRYCMLSCEVDLDCREGYECRTTGTRGSEAVPDINAEPLNPQDPPATRKYEPRQLQFCAQK